VFLPHNDSALNGSMNVKWKECRTHHDVFRVTFKHLHGWP